MAFLLLHIMVFFSILCKVKLKRLYGNKGLCEVELSRNWNTVKLEPKGITECEDVLGFYFSFVHYDTLQKPKKSKKWDVQSLHSILCNAPENSGGTVLGRVPSGYTKRFQASALQTT